MPDDENLSRGLVLLGCGRMGSALLQGWLSRGLRPDLVWVVDPQPGGWLRETGVHVNAALPDAPAAVVIAVKPQMIGAALPQLAEKGGGGTLFLSIAAGTTLATCEALLGAQTPVVRAMPNLPASIGRSITAMIGNARATPADLRLAKGILSAVGQVVRVETEDQMDAVTAVSGSGPAYVFHLIETLAAAGIAQGLPAALAVRLATATVSGAAELAGTSTKTAGQLRAEVTSPGGTTEAALAGLMDETRGFPALVNAAVRAATMRSRELQGQPDRR